jgi:rubredoxin
MYLVTPEIYKKLLDSADAREKIKVQELNKPEMGNENGAFPAILASPDIHNDSSQNDNRGSDDDDDDHMDDDDGDYYNPPPPPFNRHSSSTETASRHSSNSSTDTASETERYMQEHPEYNETNTLVQNPQNTAFQLEDDDDGNFSSSFAQHPNLLPQTSTSTQAILSENDISPELNEMMSKMTKIKKAALEQQKFLLELNKKAVENLQNRNKRSKKNVLPAIDFFPQNQPIVPQPLGNFPSLANDQQQALIQYPSTSITQSARQPMNTGTRQKAYKCALCDLTFISNRLLIQHQKDFHKPSNLQQQNRVQAQVPVVPQPLGNFANLANVQQEAQIQFPSISQSTKQTIDTGTKQKVYKCTLCNLIFISNRLLTQHQKDFHNPKNNKLSGITKKKPLPKEKYINWKKVKDENISELKKKKVKIEKKIPEILLSSGDTSIASLPKSNNSLMESSLIIPNIDSASMESISVLQCKLCPATFNTQKGLERHLKNIHESDINYVSNQPQGKKRKIENTNGNIPEKTSGKKKLSTKFYKCKLCDYSFKEEKALDRHINNIHDSSKTYAYKLPQGEKRKRPKDENQYNKNEYKKWK